MKQRKNYKSRFPVVAGNDVGEVEFFSYLFMFLELINKTARLSHESGNLLLPMCYTSRSIRMCSGFVEKLKVKG